MGCFHTFCNHHTEVKLPHRTLSIAVDAFLLPRAVGRRDVCSTGRRASWCPRTWTQKSPRSRPSSRASLQRVASGRVPGQARSTGCCRPRSRCCRRECRPAGLAAVQRPAGLAARARAVVAVLAVAMVVAAAGVAGAAAAAAGAAVSTAVAAVAAVEGQLRRTSWAGAQRLGSPRRTLGQHRAWAVRRRATPSSTR